MREQTIMESDTTSSPNYLFLPWTSQLTSLGFSFLICKPLFRDCINEGMLHTNLVHVECSITLSFSPQTGWHKDTETHIIHLHIKRCFSIVHKALVSKPLINFEHAISSTKTRKHGKPITFENSFNLELLKSYVKTSNLHSHN